MPILLISLALRHPSGLPHAETLGIPAWVQWLIVAAVVALGVWLVVGGREPTRGDAVASGRPAGDGSSEESIEWEAGEALVAGRSIRAPTLSVARSAAVAGAESGLGADEVTAVAGSAARRPAAGPAWIELAPGAQRQLPVAGAVYVEAGAPDLAGERGRLTVHRASLPRLAGPPVPTEIEAGRMVRLGTGDLVVAPRAGRLVARNSTDRLVSLLVLDADAVGPPAWLNPVRLLTLVLGVSAGVLALDRARAVEALASFLTGASGAGRVVNVSRLGFALAALFLVGGALAPTAPRAAALAFVMAAALAAFLAAASRWEERLEWWGAEYVLTAWERLPFWSAGAVGLALLALAGWRYRRGRR